MDPSTPRLSRAAVSLLVAKAMLKPTETTLGPEHEEPEKHHGDTREREAQAVDDVEETCFK